MRKFALPGIAAAAVVAALAFASGGAAGPPEYEPAYFGGETVTINAIELKQNEHALEQASAELYATTRPTRRTTPPSTPPICCSCRSCPRRLSMRSSPPATRSRSTRATTSSARS